MKRIKPWIGAGLAVVVAVVMSVPASAHVTPDPDSAPKGAADQTITFRVPDESDSASTVKLELQLPQDHPIAAVDPAEMAGWTSTVETRKLDTPITTDDGTITEVPASITWTGGKITPGHVGLFTVVAMGLPDDTDTLTFKAVQTYDDGTEVSWIETDSGAEHPAPVVKLTAAEGDSHSGATTTEVPAATTTVATTDSSKGLAVAALIVGALGVLVGGVALLGKRRAA